MKKNKELEAYQKMLIATLELSEANKFMTPIRVVEEFNNYWHKYHSKDFSTKETLPSKNSGGNEK
jgi:hypothetical protein